MNVRTSAVAAHDQTPKSHSPGTDNMLSALQQLYRAILNTPAQSPVERVGEDRLTFRGPVMVTADDHGHFAFNADARTRTCIVRHTGVIRPCQLHLAGLHGDGQTFSIRLTDRLGGCVQLAAHILHRHVGQVGNRVSIRFSFQGLTDHLDEAHPQFSHSGAMSGQMELRGRVGDPASWTCRLIARYHAAPDQQDAVVQIVRQDQPQTAA